MQQVVLPTGSRLLGGGIAVSLQETVAELVEGS
jgi:hypothetical protein